MCTFHCFFLVVAGPAWNENDWETLRMVIIIFFWIFACAWICNGWRSSIFFWRKSSTNVPHGAGNDGLLYTPQNSFCLITQRIVCSSRVTLESCVTPPIFISSSYSRCVWCIITSFFHRAVVQRRTQRKEKGSIKSRWPISLCLAFICVPRVSVLLELKLYFFSFCFYWHMQEKKGSFDWCVVDILGGGGMQSVEIILCYLGELDGDSLLCMIIRFLESCRWNPFYWEGPVYLRVK